MLKDMVGQNKKAIGLKNFQALSYVSTFKTSIPTAEDFFHGKSSPAIFLSCEKVVGRGSIFEVTRFLARDLLRL